MTANVTAIGKTWSEQEKQALRARSNEVEALKKWAESHKKEWFDLKSRCDSEWSELAREEGHGPLIFGSEAFVHIPTGECTINRDWWETQNEQSMEKAIKQDPGLLCSTYAYPDDCTEVPHRLRIFVDPKKGAVKTLRYALW